MRKIRTGTLLILGVLFLLATGPLIVGVDCLRPVKDATGAQIFRPDGKMLMETDTWGNIKVQWMSEVSLLLSLTCFIWCLVRFIRWFHGRSRA